MDTKKIILAGIAATIVYPVWYWLNFLINAWFLNWTYQLESKNIWMLMKNLEMEFMGIDFITLIFSGLILGMILALVYAILYKGIPGQGIKKGLCFGLLVWAVCGLPGIFFVAITGLSIYWTLSELVKLLILGAVIAAIYKEPSA